MVNTRGQYAPRSVQAARQVLLELTDIFQDDLDHLVFIGGMACSLLFDQNIDPHEGTIDVDIALDPVALAEYGTYTLEEKLVYANFQQDSPKVKLGETEPRPAKKYRWFRNVHVENDSIVVEVAVDLLSGEYDDSRRYEGAREVQGLHASVLRGMDLAFLYPKKVPLAGILPNGKPHQAEIQVCNAASLLAMKGLAIMDREKGADKDAIDIDYILRRYPGGPSALAGVLQTLYYDENGLVQEGLRGIATAFQSVDALGPTSIATMDRYPDPEERARTRQGAFLRVQRLLADLNFAIEN